MITAKKSPFCKTLYPSAASASSSGVAGMTGTTGAASVVLAGAEKAVVEAATGISTASSWPGWNSACPYSSSEAHS